MVDVSDLSKEDSLPELNVSKSESESDGSYRRYDFPLEFSLPMR